MIKNLKFREDWNRGVVVVFENNWPVYSNRDYSGAASWTKSKYNLTDSELMELYYDYKQDYDS